MPKHDRQRAWSRLACAALLLALSACSGASKGAAPSSTPQPTPVTVTPIVTAVSSTVSAPTTTAPPATLPAATTTTPISTTVATTTTIGPPTGRYKITTTTKSTGTQGGTGALVVARKSGFDRGYLLAISASVRAKYKVAAGWTLEDINDDPVWTPGGCAGMPNVVVGNRYEVFMDADYQPGQVFGSGIRMTVFDLKERTFSSVLPSPNDVIYVGNAPRVVDDHTVDLMIVKATLTEKVENVKDVPVFLRRIDLRSGEYREWPVTGLPDDLRTLGPSQSAFYFLQIGPADSFRIVDGSAQYVRFSAKDEERYTPAAIDGVQQNGKRNDDLLFMDLVTGEERAALHSWRHPEPYGWRGIWRYPACITRQTPRGIGCSTTPPNRSQSRTPAESSCSASLKTLENRNRRDGIDRSVVLLGMWKLACQQN
jgi:hypothetical protein